MVQDGSSSVIRLEGNVDISSAGELKAASLKAIQTGGAVRVVLEGATCLDVTAIEILWAAERAAALQGLSLTLEGQLPEAISTALREAGFDGFPLPVQTAAPTPAHPEERPS
jgi:anti-anti-sigma regulatory factor